MIQGTVVNRSSYELKVIYNYIYNPFNFIDTILIQIDFLDFPIRPGVEVFEQQNDPAADECAQAPRRTDVWNIGKHR